VNVSATFLERLSCCLCTSRDHLANITLWPIACVKFTPKLHLFYQLQDDDKKEDFEIVFCSVDRSEAEYKEYSEQMPWWCLPYALSTLPKLTTIYQAHGMPHLVVIDKNGSVITKNGVESLTQDPVGSKFPWRPLRVVDLLPHYYMIEDTSGNEALIPVQNLDDKYLMLYFSSNSSSLSQDFDPWLVKAYNILKEKRPNDFEVCCDSWTTSIAVVFPILLICVHSFPS